MTKGKFPRHKELNFLKVARGSHLTLRPLCRCVKIKIMNKQAKYPDHAAQIVAGLKELYPRALTVLQYKSAWELLVATVLAAQCTDARVNTVTPAFFRRWSGPAELSRAEIAELEEVIRSTGFFHNKAKNLLACAKIVHNDLNDELPRSIDELIKLPGVARKTANVILFGAWGINEGIAVDTHVRRISFRLGLTENTDPVHIERDLMSRFPKDEWGALNQRMVLFGREVCVARKPLCSTCLLHKLCPKLEPPKPAGKKTGRSQNEP